MFLRAVAMLCKSVDDFLIDMLRSIASIIFLASPAPGELTGGFIVLLNSSCPVGEKIVPIGFVSLAGSGSCFDAGDVGRLPVSVSFFSCGMCWTEEAVSNFDSGRAADAIWLAFSLNIMMGFELPTFMRADTSGEIAGFVLDVIGGN